jgi:small conductance mechanosensitive channel
MDGGLTSMSVILTKLQELVTVYGLKLLGAVAIFIIGKWAVRLAINLLKRLMMKGEKADITLISYTGSALYIALMAFVVIAALNQAGIQTASFIAVLGAAGLAIGLALQGSLANFASGLLIIISHPFKINDIIEGAGVKGTVQEINILTTNLRSEDKIIIIPNAKLTSDIISNFSAE